MKTGPTRPTRPTRPALRVLAIAMTAMCCPDVALAQTGGQRFEFGVQVALAKSSEFDRLDTGVGGRASWHPDDLFGLEAEMNVYPGDFPDRVPFSRSRVEGLFGVTAGPRLAGVRPFAKFRPGFLSFREAPGPIACILIYPPPLSCTLASGRTLLAVDLGGGIEVFTPRRTFLRVDIGDRLVKYPGLVFDSSRVVRESAFFSHDFRVAIGGGLRF